MFLSTRRGVGKEWMAVNVLTKYERVHLSPFKNTYKTELAHFGTICSLHIAL